MLLIQSIRRYFSRWSQAGRDAAELMKASSVLEKHGLKPLIWSDDLNYRPMLADNGELIKDELELRVAANTLRRFGCIIVDQNGNLIGKLNLLAPTTGEIAGERRASFKLVKT